MAKIMTGKRSLIVLVSLILLFTIAGCSHKKVGVKKVILRYLSYEYLPSQVVIHKAIVDAFNNSQDKVFVKFEPSEKATEKLLVQVAGGDAPDVFLCYYVYEMAKKGILLEITPYMESSKINTKDYFPWLFDALKTKLDGKLYAFPMSWGADALAYNKDLFDKAGLAYPDDSWTWDDFVKTAQKLTVKKEGRVIQYGTALPFDHVVLLSFGARRFNDNLTRCLLDSPEAKRAFQFLVDLGSKYKVIPSLAAIPKGEQYQTAMEMFMTGKVAMYITTTSQLEALGKIKGFSWDVGPIPRFGQIKRTGSPGINTMAIYSKTKHPKEAWEFVKFVCGPDGQKLLGKNCIPAHKAIAYKYWLTPPPEHLRIMIDQYEITTVFAEYFSSWGREYVDSIYQPQLEKMLLGLQSVEKSTETLTQKGNEFLKSI